MKIHEFSTRSGLSAKTIRYYESIGILPNPPRAPNGYREYDDRDAERVKFVVGARQLDLSLDDIRELLAMRDMREAPCRILLDLIDQKANEIQARIQALQKLERELRELHSLGMNFSVDDIDGKNCICHLVSERSNVRIS